MNYRRALACSFLIVSLLWSGLVWGENGAPIWEQTFDYLPNYDVVNISCLAASSSTLVVCGSASKTTSNSGQAVVSLGFIRAYDVVTGKPKWQGTQLTLASTQGAINQNNFGNIIVNGNIAMVQGVAYSFTINSQEPWQTLILSKTILRAYNINTGQLLWENIKDGFSDVMQGTNTFTMSNLVFIGGSDKPAISAFTPNSAWVRAYQVPGTNLQGLSLLLDEKK
jgi:outer membrane protein assembly factor BamB